jgi:hypothetical protein
MEEEKKKKPQYSPSLIFIILNSQYTMRAQQDSERRYKFEADHRQPCSAFLHYGFLPYLEGLTQSMHPGPL